MHPYLADFANLDWVDDGPGLQTKVLVQGKNRIRLARFSEGFEEEGWCRKAHLGYVLTGSGTLNFGGEMVPVKAGDGLAIPGGEAGQHKMQIAPGEQIVILLFETI